MAACRFHHKLCFSSCIATARPCPRSQRQSYDFSFRPPKGSCVCALSTSLCRRIQAAGRSKFYDTWHCLLPHISVSTPSSDLCFVCQQNNLAIQQAVCLSDNEKSARIQVPQRHLHRAKIEREYYNVQVKEAQEHYKDSVKCQSNPIQMHYSFDFAQQVHYPYDAQQTGPEYFKLARKCGIFGVCNDGKSNQVCYLIDEAENPGKGADCVISMIDHYFTVHGCHEKDVSYT